jgi:hypothetical protein
MAPRRIFLPAALAVLLLSWPAGSAHAQQPLGIRALAPSVRIAPNLRLQDTGGSRRLQHAVWGGVIGGAVGIITCTVISNIAKDPGTGFSTCTTKGYLGMGLGGLVLGAGIGALIP